MIEKLRYFLVFIILILFSLIGCDLFTNNSDSETEKSVINNGIEYTLTIEKNIYSIIDSLRIEFVLTNKGITSKNFNFNNIQQFGFMLKDGDNDVALSYPSIVSPALSHFELVSNQSKKFSITYPFKNFSGIYISKGEYTLSVYLLDNNSPEVSLKISIL